MCGLFGRSKLQATADRSPMSLASMRRPAYRSSEQDKTMVLSMSVPLAVTLPVRSSPADQVDVAGAEAFVHRGELARERQSPGCARTGPSASACSISERIVHQLSELGAGA
jgi:hypothetical protein